MKIIVGDYTKASSVFNGLCLVDTSYAYIKKHYEGVVKKTEAFVKEHKVRRVFDLGKAKNTPRFFYFPHQASEVQASCQQLTEIADKRGYDRVLIPMPSNYAEISTELEKLDDRFTIITDNADYILTSDKPVESVEPPKILECSSKGDSRFSALYAQVEYNGKTCTIEKHYQDSKRFRNEQGLYLKVTNPKGQKVDGAEVYGTIYEPAILTPFYKYLWYKYFKKNAYLLEYAKEFDDFTDAFRGKSINCQADVIREMIKEPEKFMADVSIIANLEPQAQASFQQPENFMHQNLQGDIIKHKTAVCVTGHRPKDIFGYNECAQYTQLQNKIFSCLTQFVTQFGVERFISGGAQGADQLFFWVGDYVKTLHNNVTNDVFVPFKGQEVAWSAHGKFSTTEYHQMLERADNIKYVDESFEIKVKGEENPKVVPALLNRNLAMLNESDYVLGVYKGTAEEIKSSEPSRGGTIHCLKEAYKRGKKIVVINPYTLETFKLNW